MKQKLIESQQISAVNCIKKIRDIAILKMKVNESLSVFPKEYASVGKVKVSEPSSSPRKKLKKQSERFDCDGDASSSQIHENSNIEDIIKKEKKSLKISKKNLHKIKSLYESESNYLANQHKDNKNSKSIHHTEDNSLSREISHTINDYFTIYVDELEKNFMEVKL